MANLQLDVDHGAVWTGLRVATAPVCARITRMDGDGWSRLGVRLAGVALLACLLLPWFSGSDDGESLRVAGWDTEPGFTAGMIAVGLVLLALPTSPGMAARWLPLVVTLVAIGLTLWMLPRGERYSAPNLILGSYVTLAVEAALLLLAIRIAMTQIDP
jgi:hypothetical protein